MEFLNFANILLLMIAGYMILHMILTTPVNSYNFSSIVRLSFMLAFTGIFLTGAIITTTEFRFRNEGVVTYAKPSEFTSKSTSDFTNNVEYSLTYQFQDKFGKSYQNVASIDKYEWELLKSLPDPKIKIIYLENAAEKNKLESQDSYYSGIFMTFLGIAGFIALLLRKKRYKYQTLSYQQMASNSHASYKREIDNSEKDQD